MEDYPGWKENNIPIEFMEEMRESLTSSCDIGCWTKDEYEGIKYPERYDFSFLNKHKDPHFWFLDSLSDKIKERAYNVMKGHKTVEDKRKALFKNIAEIKYLPYEWENPESNYLRVHLKCKNN